MVGAVSKDGKGQAIGWWDGQTQFQAAGARQALGSLITANPNDLTQPNYNFVKKAMMSGADGFTDGDYFTYANSAGQPVAVHNVGQAYEVSSGKYIPVGLKVTINDATYYDGVNASPHDVFADGYKLMVAARNDGAGNITMGYVVVMTGVPPWITAVVVKEAVALDLDKPMVGLQLGFLKVLRLQYLMLMRLQVKFYPITHYQ